MQLVSIATIATFLGITAILTNFPLIVFSQSPTNTTTTNGISERLPLTLSGTIHHFTNNDTQSPGV